jgi:phospholipid/cholesterol/gamma-HCH transport system substrate-binding protein
MNTDSSHRIKLGFFVITSLSLLIAGLYLIGKNKNIWGKTYTLTAHFGNVGGLQPGNNVRYSGIDIGTVDGIEIINDTTIEVILLIDRKMEHIIRSNSVASIGTDGLMGNKLVNIEPGTDYTSTAKENDVLPSIKTVDTENMLRTLESTNRNIELISSNLIRFTTTINESRGTLYTMLMDTALAESLHMTLQNIEMISRNLSLFSRRISEMSDDVKKGNGILGTLISDSVQANKNLHESIINLNKGSKNIEQITRQIGAILEKVEKGNGTAAKLIQDSVLANQLAHTIQYIDSSAIHFNDNMEALKKTFILRKYFKKKKETK